MLCTYYGPTKTGLVSRKVHVHKINSNYNWCFRLQLKTGTYIDAAYSACYSDILYILYEKPMYTPFLALYHLIMKNQSLGRAGAKPHTTEFYAFLGILLLYL